MYRSISQSHIVQGQTKVTTLGPVRRRRHRAYGEDMAVDRDGFPPGVPCWVDTAQPDPEAAAAFYGDLFGWELEDRMPAGAPGHYFVARLGGRQVVAVGSQFDGAPPTPVFMQPFDVLDAGRMAVCADPAGATFNLWEPGTHRGAETVNAPGTWNWSDLHTSDPEGAKAFYGTVFGWEADDTDFGGLMWRLPGYADFLERFDPGLRQRHSDFGAPPGFSEAIGWMMPLEDGQPHWRVTFSVEDADAIAARTVELGGRVVEGPVDAGPTRTAVLADPQGALFTISHFRP